jgi:hypothetical protein
MSRHFISFGNSAFTRSRDRILQEVNTLGVFDHVCVYNEQDLEKKDAGFWRTFEPFAKSYKKGFGYYIWKPFLVYKHMVESMNDNDILVYADAGCKLYPQFKKRLLDYFSMAYNSDKGIVCFKLDSNLTMSRWTRRDIFKLFDKHDDPAFANQSQICATTFILRKCEHTLTLIREWLEYALNYPTFFTDLPSTIPNFPDFIENRYDQSFFSLLCYLKGACVLEDETWPSGVRGPIGAARIRE